METWVAGGDKDKLVRKREEVRKNEWVRDVLERRRSSASETSLASMQSLMSAGSGGSGDKQDEEVRKVQNALKTTDLETVGRLEEEYPMRLKELEELLNESPVRMVRLRIAERVMGVFGAYGAKEGGGKGGIGTTELLKLCKVVGSVVYVNGAVASVPDGSEATWDARYKSYAELFFKDGWGKEGQFEGFVTTDGAKEWEEEGREDERVRRILIKPTKENIAGLKVEGKEGEGVGTVVCYRGYSEQGGRYDCMFELNPGEDEEGDLKEVFERVAVLGKTRGRRSSNANKPPRAVKKEKEGWGVWYRNTDEGIDVRLGDPIEWYIEVGEVPEIFRERLDEDGELFFCSPLTPPEGSSFPAKWVALRKWRNRSVVWGGDGNWEEARGKWEQCKKEVFGGVVI